MTTPNAEPTKAVATVPAQPRPNADASLSMFATEANFALAQRAATALAASALVPQEYRDKPANCLVAMDLAAHMGLSPLMVMQNLHIIHGKPSWGSPFIIGAINTCGKFSPLRFHIERRGKKKVEVTTWVGARGDRKASRSIVEIEDTTCHAYATDLATGETVKGPPVSIEMATAEGWTAKAESKWATMPELMLTYRAATFFGRVYAPEILMGFMTADEAMDVGERPPKTTARATASAGASALQDAIETATGDKPAAAVAEPAEPADDPEPRPSDAVAQAQAKEVAGIPLSSAEVKALDDFNLELDDWRARQKGNE